MQEIQQIQSEIDKLLTLFTPQSDLQMAIEQLSTEYKTNTLILEEKQKKLSLLKLEKKKELHILAHIKESQ